MKWKHELDRLLKESLEETKLPGLALAISNDRDVIYSSAFGVRNIHSKEVLTTEHIFHLASLSKTFVCTAILQLAEQGKLHLSQTVVSILPYFKMDDSRFHEIRLHQILNHSSGMPDDVDYEWDNPQYDEGAAERYVRSLASKKLIANPGEQFAYSNIAFDVLGDVIAKVSGTTFEDYIEKNIFTPLKMEKSSFLIRSIRKDLLVSPHIWDGGVKVNEHYPYNRRHAPSSTLNSNILEMSHWIIANLNHGSYFNCSILSKESHKRSWEPSIDIDSHRKMGLSWFLENYKGVRVISHDGCDTGFRSHLSLFPENKIGFILVSNAYFEEKTGPDVFESLSDKIRTTILNAC